MFRVVSAASRCPVALTQLLIIILHPLNYSI